MQGIIEEEKEVLKKYGNDAMRDIALIGAAQRVEHYQIAAYGAARAIAGLLGENHVVKLLQHTLDEESAADRKLRAISQGEVLSKVPGRGKNSELLKK